MDEVWEEGWRQACVHREDESLQEVFYPSHKSFLLTNSTGTR
jgi:hypothetical protein